MRKIFRQWRKNNLGKPKGIRYLPEQLKLTEEVAAAVKFNAAKSSGLAPLSTPRSL